MSKFIEIEAKYLLNKEDFIKLQQHLKLDDQKSFVQNNEYLDTLDQHLREKAWMLRIRTIGTQKELTLKKPLKEGMEETNIPISAEEYQKIIKTGRVPLTGLEKLKFVVIGRLLTKRISCPYEGGEIFLDENYYRSLYDYEVEYEVSDSLERAKKTLEELFDKLGISSYRPSRSKNYRCCY